MEANPIHRMMDEERARAEAEAAKAEPAPTETVWSEWTPGPTQLSSQKSRKRARERKHQKHQRDNYLKRNPTK